MIKSLTKLIALVASFAIAILAFNVVKGQGWLSPFGVRSESRDSQVIQAIERTQQVSLVSLSIEGIKSEKQKGTILGFNIPASEDRVFLQYSFKAKLGIDGGRVEVMNSGENSYTVSIPEFIFIGYDEPTFEVATRSGDFLSFTAPEVDQAKMVSQILDPTAQQKYLASNQDVLKDQSKTFYRTLITTIDPAASVTLEFAS